ncbi:MAG: hypothetical protein HS129_05040 [Leptospiraceae bacterium]|nr:hypothetical protein [Leptospiraceae bacterium]NUM42679.1 hypothetical protein [Leptospiraceae bacterium]
MKLKTILFITIVSLSNTTYIFPQNANPDELNNNAQEKATLPQSPDTQPQSHDTPAQPKPEPAKQVKPALTPEEQEKIAEQKKEAEEKARFEKERKEAIAVWESDSKTISDIIGELIPISYESRDETEIQKDENKTIIKNRLSKINKNNEGKNINIKRAIVENVEEIKKLSQEGEKKIKRLIRDLKKDKSKSAYLVGLDYNQYYYSEPRSALRMYLAFALWGCKDCDVGTGEYKVTFKIFIPFDEYNKGIKWGGKIKKDDLYIDNYCEKNQIGGTCDLIYADLIYTTNDKSKAIKFKKKYVYEINSKIRNIKSETVIGTPAFTFYLQD